MTGYLPYIYLKESSMSQAAQVKPEASRRRVERLEARLTTEQKALIEHAAALQGRSITDFVLTSVQEAARRAIAEHQVISLTLEDSRVLAEALLNPPAPNARLQESARRYQAINGG
jgi:uncharacterized protein (DUF1778 family)